MSVDRCVQAVRRFCVHSNLRERYHSLIEGTAVAARIGESKPTLVVDAYCWTIVACHRLRFPMLAVFPMRLLGVYPKGTSRIPVPWIRRQLLVKHLIVIIGIDSVIVIIKTHERWSLRLGGSSTR